MGFQLSMSPTIGYREHALHNRPRLIKEQCLPSRSKSCDVLVGVLVCVLVCLCVCVFVCWCVGVLVCVCVLVCCCVVLCCDAMRARPGA